MATALLAARTNLFLAPWGTGISVIASILVARWLGPEGYADFATLMALVTWLLILGESGCNVGLGRYLHEAQALNARGSLYRALQFRRWAAALMLAVLVIWLGPRWAETAELQVDQWQPVAFGLVGLLSAVMLHGQLASSAMINAFRHGQVLLLSQSMTIVRALALGGIAGLVREPVVLVSALLIVAILETFLLHRAASMEFCLEQEPLPEGMVNAAQTHGLVALFDKLTTSLSGGPFLLLMLAGAHGRHELAMLAIATDFLQKALSVVGLPISNLVFPLLNESRGDLVRFRRQVARLGGLTTVLFAGAAGGIAAVLPLGLPFLLGQSYGDAVPIAAVWLLPLFLESGVRMIWGTALLTLDQYRWLTTSNVALGVVSLLIILIVRGTDLRILLALLGLARISLCIILIGRAFRQDLVPPESRPLGIVAAAGVACALSWGTQTLLAQALPLFRLVAGMVTYMLVMLTLLRWLPLIPGPSHEALCQIAGKHIGILLRFIPPPVRWCRSA
jgi:O-antigen/teichoic acid export membrane protein